MTYPEPTTPYVTDEANLLHDVRNELDHLNSEVEQLNTERDKLTHEERRRLESVSQALASLGAPIHPVPVGRMGEVISRAAQLDEFIRQGRE